MKRLEIRRKIILRFLLSIFHFLLFTWSLAVTYNTNASNGPETLTTEVTESFDNWKALDSKLEITPAEENPESLFQYATPERFSPDMLSITVQKQQEGRQLLHLISPNADNRKRILLHEAGVAIGLTAQSTPSLANIDATKTTEAVIPDSPSDTSANETSNAESDTATTENTQTTENDSSTTDQNNSSSSDGSQTEESTNDGNTDSSSNNQDDSNQSSTEGDSQESNDSSTSENNTETSENESVDSSGNDSQNTDETNSTDASPNDQNVTTNATTANTDPNQTTDPSEGTTKSEASTETSSATTIKAWQTVMNPSINPTDETTLGDGEKELLKALNLFAKEDINKDGNVNFYDLVAISQAFGQRNVNDPADLNKDGIVNQADVDILRKVYTFSDPSPTAPGQTESSPEGQTGPETDPNQTGDNDNP